MIRITFDAVNNPEQPTLILATRSGNKIGDHPIMAKEIDMRDSLTESSEMNFTVYKYIDDVKDSLWDYLQDFKLVWWKEQNMWFELHVEVSENTETKKTCFLTQLAQAELSQLQLYNITINSEDDIARDDYVEPTVLYNPSDPSTSLLHRIMEKAPHYTITHVDDTIAGIQRVFEFDNKSLYDSFNEIQDEIGCLFVYSPMDGEPVGQINRNIAVYDTMCNCRNCGYRAESIDGVCPECGSSDIDYGYGEDTGIFVTSDELASEIGLSDDTDVIKNCFKLEAGDELMTATIRNANVNGSDYLWYFSNRFRSDMSQGLQDLLTAYEAQLETEKTRAYEIDQDVLDWYNLYIGQYSDGLPGYNTYSNPISGYATLVQAYYDAVDVKLYLESGMMPSVEISGTTAREQADIIEETMTSIAVVNINAISSETINSTVRQYAQAIVTSAYSVRVVEGTYTSATELWNGQIVVESRTDENDTYLLELNNIPLSDDYEAFVSQKIDVLINQSVVNDVSVKALFSMSDADFQAEIHKYCKNSLMSFLDITQAVIDILIKQGTADGGTWAAGNSIYDNLYLKYQSFYHWLTLEINSRSTKISDVNDFIQAVKTHIDNARDRNDIETFLGETYWRELSTYRREEKYSNDNFISDGLSNKEMLNSALEFLDKANDEIFKASERQTSISTTLNNLLHLEKFEPIKDKFSVGNWIRIQVDGYVYRLRLSEYTINYDDFSTINVEFLDKIKPSGIGTDLDKTLRAIQDAKRDASEFVSEGSTLLEQLIMAVNNASNDASGASENSSKLEERIANGELDGEGAFYVVIETSAGNIFKNRGINTILTAHAYYGSQEVTDDVTSWTWKKHNADGTEDESWSRDAGNIITLSPADVTSRAVFYCYAEYPTP